MSKSDVSGSSPARLAKMTENDETIIEFSFEDEIHENSDSHVKVKDTTKMLHYDVTRYKIVGHSETKSHKGNTSHVVLTFTIRDKKTKKMEKIDIELLKNKNEDEYTGVVTSIIGDIKNNPFQVEVGKTVKMSSIKENNGSKLTLNQRIQCLCSG